MKVYRYIYLVFVLSFQMLIAQEDCAGIEDGNTVCLSFGDVNPNDGTLEIRYNSLNPIYGFQFNLSNLNVLSASTDLGGIYTLETSGFVMGFLTATPLSASNDGLLVTVNYTPTFEIETCLSNIIIGASSGSEYPYLFEDCFTVPTADLDCMQVYGGDAFIDDCGICVEGTSGNIANSDKDDCGECFGNNYDQCDDDDDQIVNIEDACPLDSDNDIDEDGLCSNEDPCPLDFENDLDEDGVCESDEVFGCTDNTACNFDGLNTEEDGSCWYTNFGCECDDGINALPDNCGVCDTDLTNDCTADCSGVWGGDLVIDQCGICGGNDSCLDCADIPYGNAYVDECGTCDDDFSNDCQQDCSGEWGGDLEYDLCEVCGGDNSSCTDCLGTPNGLAYIDQCGSCVISPDPNCVLDCAGVWNGDAIYDDCGICNGVNQDVDQCGVCFGDGQSCIGCIDIQACNYDDLATIDNQSCIYPDEILNCNGSSIITSIIDVPSDQGGRVYVSFTSSIYDIDGISNRSEIYSVERLDNSNWVNVISGPAYGLDEYTYEVGTLVDSNHVDLGLTSFRVISSLDEGIWSSDSAVGYSVDNIAPSAPQNFTANFNNNSIILNWNDVIVDDLHYYTLYRNNTIITHTIETNFIDYPDTEEIELSYFLSARDSNNNESHLIQTDVLNTDYEVGDVDEDYSINVLDLIILVDVILDNYFGGQEPPLYVLWACDMNNDNNVNITDIVFLVNQILDISY